MEGLTVDTCSLDGSRQTSYIQLLSLANSDVLSANCQIPSVLNAQKSTIRIQPAASFVVQNTNTGSSSLKKPFVIPSSNSNSDFNRFSIDKTITGETLLCAYDDQQKTLTVLGSTNFGGRNFSALLNERNETTNLNTVENNFNAKPSPTKKSSSRVKRGWPKGKKRRKVHPTLKTPKQPATAYNLFCNQRRSVVKLENPDLSLSDIMKILGKEWSCLPKSEKQKYVALADTDMERYKFELNNYKKSPEYQEYLRNSKGVRNGGNHLISSTSLVESNAMMANQPSNSDVMQLIPATVEESRICRTGQLPIAVDDLTSTSHDLYCKDCNMYFHNIHNKMEHLRGRLHRKQNIKNFEEYLSRKDVDKKKISRFADDDSYFKQPLDMSDVITHFYQRNREQEIELTELRENVRLLTEKNNQSRCIIQGYLEVINQIGNETAASVDKRNELSRLASLLTAVPIMFQSE